MRAIKLLSQFVIFSAILILFSACRTLPILVPGVHVSGGGHSGGHPPAHAPAHGRRGHHNYHYYPDVEVYFDVGRQSYFYLSGAAWTVSATLPRALRVQLGSHVSMELDTVRPYDYHHKHKKHYPRGHFKKKHRNKHRKKNKGRHQGKHKKNSW